MIALVTLGFVGAFQEEITRIGASVLIGGLVGLEREVRSKAAGIRTMILICTGACIFSMVSDNVSGPMVDRSRIAAQIVSGVGFLGAGAILRDRGRVQGLTTAAAIWLVAATGMACGFGMYTIAFTGAVVTGVVLLLFQYVVRPISRRRETRSYRIATDGEVTLKDLERMFREFKLSVLHRNMYEDDEAIIFELRARGHFKMHLGLRERLIAMDHVRVHR